MKRRLRRLRWGVLGAAIVLALLVATNVHDLLVTYVPEVEIRTEPLIRFAPAPGRSGGAQFCVADLDQDGIGDVVSFNGNGVIARSVAADQSRVLWVRSLSTDFSIPNSGVADPASLGNYRFLIGNLADFDDDQRPEIVTTIASCKGDRWRCQVFSGLDGRGLQNLDLPIGDDTRPDGYWDGCYTVIGTLQPGVAAPGACTTALIVRNVEYDRLDRGLVALDLESGNEVWSYHLCTNPSPRQSHVVDLDLDGSPEIVVMGDAPGNYTTADSVRYGCRDNALTLYAIDATGQEIWHTELTHNWGSVGLCEVVDLDGDGQPEIIAATRQGRAGSADQLLALDATGRVIDRVDLSGPAYTLAVADREMDEPKVFVTTGEGGLHRIGWQDGTWRLERSRELASRLYIEGLARIGTGREFLVSRTDADIRLYGLDLALAMKLLPGGGGLRDLVSHPLTDDRALLGWRTDQWYLSELVPNPLHRVANVLLVALPIALSAVGSRQKAPPPDRRLLVCKLARCFMRDNHDQLVLEKSLNHIKCCLMQFDTFDEREDQLVGTHLQGFYEAVQLAADLDIGRSERERLTSRLEEFQKIAEGIIQIGHSPSRTDRTSERFRELAGEIPAAMQDLRKEFARREGRDLYRSVLDLLHCHEAAFQASGVELIAEDRPSRSASVIISPADLKHLVDNLVRNACRAMSASELRILRFICRVENGRAICEFTDTGPGFDQETKRNLFKQPVASKCGTGEGLCRDARAIRRHDGQIELVETGQASGACIRVSFPLI